MVPADPAEAHLNAAAGEVVHEAIDDVPKVAALGEDAVYEVHTKHTQGLLLRLRCAVQHARVQHHRVGWAPAFDPTVRFIL